MPNPTHKVAWFRDGKCLWESIIPSAEVAIAGDFHKGVPYQPDGLTLYARVPTRICVALQRAGSFWMWSHPHQDGWTGYMNLTSSKGKPMGVLMCKPRWGGAAPQT